MMKEHSETINVSDDDWKEIFALFCSSAKEERDQIYDPTDFLYFKKENLDEEYNLSMTKRDFAIDAWRGVLAFLHSKGYMLVKDDHTINLSFIEDAFI